MTMEHIDLRKQYDDLCAERDRRNALNLPLQAELDKINSEIEALRVRAANLADQIEVNWGRGEWIVLKKNIGQLAKALSGSHGK